MSGQPKPDTAAIRLKLAREIERTDDPARKAELFGHLHLIEASKTLAAGLPDNETARELLPEIYAEIDAVQEKSDAFLAELVKAIDTLDLAAHPDVDRLLAQSQEILELRQNLTARLVDLFERLGGIHDRREPGASDAKTLN